MSLSLFAVILLLSLYSISSCVSCDELFFATITLKRIVLYEFVIVVVMSIHLITLVLIIAAHVSFFIGDGSN